jgi:putative DNA primase/helicase
MAAATVATVATVAVANNILPKKTVGCDLDLDPENIQLLRGALAVIPTGAMMGRHKTEEVIGWGLRHNNSGILTEVGATLCSEWDKRTGGKSLETFIISDPNYNDAQPVTTASIFALAREHGWTGQIPWPTPEPLITVEKPAPYPLGALPGSIGLAVAEVVEFVQSPVSLTACSALAVVSTAVQGLVDVRRDYGLEGPVGIFTLALADSGERKTSSDSHFSKPLQQWEAEKAEAARPEIKKYAADIAIWDASKSGLMSAISTASKSNKSTNELAIQVNELENNKPEEPKVPRLLYADATPEALAYSLAHKWPTGAVMSSEAGVVLGGHAMGNDSAMRNMGILNCFWDGTPVPIDRRSTTSYTVRNVRLTMALAVQPETIRAFLDSSKGLARGIGFLARFLIAWPESTQGKRKFKDAPKTWPELGRFHRRLGTLLDYPLTYDSEGYLSPIMLELTPEAKKKWVAFYDDVEAELNPGRDMAEAKDVASKAADNAVRLAALFHVFEVGIEGQISVEHMEAGAVIAGWHLYEARRFMRELAVDISISNAVTLDGWLIGWCRHNNVAEIKRRHLQQNGPGCVRSGEKLTPAIKELADLGRVREVKVGKQKIIEINPILLED